MQSKIENEVPFVRFDGSTIVNPAWFKNWFDSSFYHQLYAHRDENEAILFIEALIRYLKPRAQSRILDLGCGAGRHSKYLAYKGFKVTGLDLARSSILMAKRFETKNLRFGQHDMRVPFGEEQFDILFSFFTSFGYFGDNSEDQRVMQNISNSLKPGGTLMMDYLNVGYSEQHIVHNEEKEIDGIVCHITRWMTDSHFFKKIEITDSKTNEPHVFTERVAKFSLYDFEILFLKHGLRLKKVFGDYQLNQFNPLTSPRLILIATKK